MRKTICAIAALALLAAPGCGKPDETPAAGRIRVAVSIFPIYDIKKNICGDAADLFYAIPAGADPHTFEPRPSVARDLGAADLFIGVTPELDGWVARYL